MSRGLEHVAIVGADTLVLDQHVKHTVVHLVDLIKHRSATNVVRDITYMSSDVKAFLLELFDSCTHVVFAS